MKKLTILLLLVAFQSIAQVKIDKNGNFYSQSVKKTSFTLTTKLYTDSKGVIYSVYTNGEGDYYIVKTSKKTGKQYRHKLNFKK